MFKCTATKFDTQLTTTRQRLTCAVHISTLSHTSCSMLGSRLFQRMNSESHKYVYCSQIDINMGHFTWAKLVDFHLAYGAVYGNGRETQRIYNEHFPNTVCPDYRTFASVNHHLQETRTLAVNRHRTGWVWSVRTPHFDEDVLQRFEKNPSASTHAVGHIVSVERCTQAVAPSLPSAEGAGSTRPPMITFIETRDYFLSILVLCAPE